MRRLSVVLCSVHTWRLAVIGKLSCDDLTLGRASRVLARRATGLKNAEKHVIDLTAFFCFHLHFISLCLHALQRNPASTSIIPPAPNASISMEE